MENKLDVCKCCGNKYLIYPSYLKNLGYTFRCGVCGYRISIYKTEAEAALDALLEVNRNE